VDGSQYMDKVNKIVDTDKNKMLTIAIMNSKGGSGKTTIATNLASYYAAQDLKTVMVDQDVQGSSVQWLKRRSEKSPIINTTVVFDQPTNYTRSWLARVPTGTQRVLIDTPAGIEVQQIENVAKRADIIIVPVLLSPIDSEAVGIFLRRLKNILSKKHEMTHLAVVANRVGQKTRSYKILETCLLNMKVPFIATLRDSQNYIQASEQGIGVHELKNRKITHDLLQWQPLLDWIELKESSSARYLETNMSSKIHSASGVCQTSVS